jgi:hypothetical protein
LSDQAPPYRPRPVRFIELLEGDGWSIKVYGIAVARERPGQALLDAAKGLALRTLRSAAESPMHHGAAFVIAHEAREANLVLVDWWVGENMLEHRVFSSPLVDPGALAPLEPAGIVACVWELAVLWFERQAWIETVLADSSRANLEAYRARRLNADV